eukprot:5353199-Amphidinium_carterae.1
MPKIGNHKKWETSVFEENVFTLGATLKVEALAEVLWWFRWRRTNTLQLRSSAKQNSAQKPQTL